MADATTLPPEIEAQITKLGNSIWKKDQRDAEEALRALLAPLVADAARWNVVRHYLNGENRIHMTSAWGTAGIYVRDVRSDAVVDDSEDDTIDGALDAIVRDGVKALDGAA